MTMTIQRDASDAIAGLDALVKNLPREIHIINSKTAKRGKSFIAKEVTKELAIAQKNVKKIITVRNHRDDAWMVSLKHTDRPPLRDFKARQTKKGVTAKISRNSKRKLYRHAFMGPRPGLTFVKTNGRVFARKGQSRYPIYQLKGASPWGVLRKGNRMGRVRDQLENELNKQTLERLRYQKLKHAGVI